MIALFGGTTESLAIAEKLKSSGHPFMLFTATDFHVHAHIRQEAINHQVGPLNQQEMELVFQKENIKMVIDATHPFAVQVSENLMHVCQGLLIPYYRFERQSTSTGKSHHVRRFSNYDEGIQFLQNTEGNILLSTGSHSVSLFTRSLPTERLYVRVLPIPEILKKTIEAGVIKDHMMAMKGPFSQEMNVAMIKFWNISYLVSKDSGSQGGLEEKIKSVEETKTQLILIERPKMDYPKAYNNLDRLFKDIKNKMEALKHV